MMKTAKWTASVAALALLSACNKPAEPGNSTAPTNQTATPTNTDWTATVVRTEEAGYRMGNPNAAVKLIEYGALTCPHCARFSMDSRSDIEEMVKKGTLSYELRTFVVHPGYDEIPSIVSKCKGAEPFFIIVDKLFATQETWVGEYGKFTPEEKAAMKALPEKEALAKVAEKLGLTKMVGQLGVTPDQVKACLADPKGNEELKAINTLAISKYDVSGTPTFIINGQKVENVNTWADLKPLVVQAGA